MLLIWIFIGGSVFLGFQYFYKPSTALNTIVEKSFISYHDMKEIDENDDRKSQLYVAMYLKGIQEGFKFSNVILANSEKRPLFCVSTKNLALNLLEVKNIMDEYYNSVAIEDQNQFDKAPLSMIYIVSMIHKYPCNK